MSVRVVIRGGTVFDGLGGAGRPGDVLIEDGRIAQVGAVAAQAEEIDAAGLAVAPGFIDIHSHSDYTLLADPRAVSALSQGVTTEVVGNCGFGCFPIADPQVARRAIYGYSDALPITWRSAGEYFDALAAVRPAVNVLSLVPNGQLRLATIGLVGRPANQRELRTMQGLLRESLRDGAWGFSTGLEYAQEQGATEMEITELARLAPYYATHTRARGEGAADALREAIRTARRAEVRLQVSHLVPRNGARETRRCLELVEEARHGGQDVAFDMHTRRFGLTNLYAVLPPWALGADPEQLRAILGVPARRDEMRRHPSLLSTFGDWSRVTLLDNEFWPEYARRDISSIAADRGQEPQDAIYDLLLPAVEQLQALLVIIHSYTEQQQCQVFSHPLCVPESDATTLAPDGPLASAIFHGAYTWAAWFWRFMVREHQLLEAHEAIRRLTSAPAERIGLSDRGVLRVGALADIVVFDPATFADRGTTFQPNVPAEGVHHVLVNGAVAVRDGRLTGERAGQVLRR